MSADPERIVHTLKAVAARYRDLLTEIERTTRALQDLDGAVEALELPPMEVWINVYESLDGERYMGGAIHSSRDGAVFARSVGGTPVRFREVPS